MHEHELIKSPYFFFPLRASSTCLRLHPCLVVPSIFLLLFASVKCFTWQTPVRHSDLQSQYHQGNNEIIKKILNFIYRDVYKWGVGLPHFFVKTLSFTTPYLVIRKTQSSRSPLQCLYILLPFILHVSPEKRKCNAQGNVRTIQQYRGADKSLARRTSQ